MMRGLLPFPVLALMALPVLADAPQDACLPLTDVAELCLQDTDWATGYWMQGGDGSALTLGNVTLADHGASLPPPEHLTGVAQGEDVPVEATSSATAASSPCAP